MISLRECHNVTLRDFSIYHGGHFGILATGVDNFTISNLRIDTNATAWTSTVASTCTSRIAALIHLPMRNLPEKRLRPRGVRACENITITNCHVSGFDEGSFLNGTFTREAKTFGGQDSPRDASSLERVQRRFQEYRHLQLHVRLLPRPCIGGSGRRIARRRERIQYHNAGRHQLSDLHPARFARSQSAGVVPGFSGG